jgi:deazaflavin-dependent oxidoreductase (nitroreductase family)
MRPAFWLLLLIVVAGGCASAYVRSALRSETGRKRLLPVLRPLMRVINPGVVRAVERRESNFAVVHHTGRRSGTTYHTPVDVARTSDGVLISLPYGPQTDWCRNVLAAQHCTLTVDGDELTVSAPEVVLAPSANARPAIEKLHQWERERIAHYLSLKCAPVATSALGDLAVQGAVGGNN